MWRDTKQKNRSNIAVNNNRLRLVVAVIFLLIGSVIYKLYSVQIGQFDMYTAMASSQHHIYSKLVPERGKIFFGERTQNGSEKLYPLATNKDFAEVFVVPLEITNPTVMAEKLYNFFDKPKLEAELKAKQATGTEVMVATSTREEIIAKYLKKTDKPGDPYEPLVSKLDGEELIKLYSYFSADATSTSSNPTVSPEDLELKLGQLVYKNNPDKDFSIPGLGFDLQPYRFYPENEIASQILGFVTYNDGEGQGQYGLEEFFNEELFGKYGSLKTEKGGAGSVMIVNDREYIKPDPGSDIVLTIDRNIESMACQKLKEAVEKHGASGGSVIVMNPKTGAIIAMCSVPDFNPNDYKNVKDISYYNNPAIFYQYEPGSVFKTVTMAISIDQGKISPATTYNDKGQIMIDGWPRPIKNSDFSTYGPHGVVDMTSVLDNSLNTGAIFAMNQVGSKVFSDYVKKFGFGEKTGIEIGSESAGNIDNLLKSKVREIDAATASFGQGLAVTPLQMLISYQVIANKGMMMKPYIVKTIIRPNGLQEETTPKQSGRIISEKTAATVSAMLVNVVEQGHAKKASIEGYYIGAKTGTAQIATVGGYSADQYIHTFIGIAPIEDPAFVMLTKIDRPKDVQYAEGSALPLWRDIADFILNYYAVAKTR
ncbi:MAG TPA: penicillin-binding protein 2 [Candidatus Saccharimonadales bacterium]|nr:penicillin-binding protein 2 [Candidatus Saccharimonadales bacterium]